MSATFIDLADIIEEAYERASGGMRMLQTGYEYRTARRSLDILTMEWANRGINLWTLEEGTIPLSRGIAGYQMPVDTIDLVEYAVRTSSGVSNSDLPLTRVSMSSYAAISNKEQLGRPQQILMRRMSPFPVLTLWPVPDSDNYTLVGWRLKKVQRTDEAGQDMDVPFRFVPALISGLAFYIAQKIPEGADRAVLLKQEYEAAFDLASLEDRDRSTLRLIPRIGSV